MNTTERASPVIVIFDLGRVLVDFDWRPAIEQAASSRSISAKMLKRGLLEGEAIKLFETGRLTAEGFHQEVEGVLGSKLPFNEFCSVWNSIFKGPIKDTFQLMASLNESSGHQVAILSNTNELHAKYLCDEFPILTKLEHVYFSHEIGFRKPDHEAYNHVLNKLGLEPSQAVFVDDLPENIQAAEEVGLRGVLATSPASVRSGLGRCGISID